MNVFYDSLYFKKITSMITYFAAVAKHNLAHKEFRATRKFHSSTLYKRLRKRQLAHDRLLYS